MHTAHPLARLAILATFLAASAASAGQVQIFDTGEYEHLKDNTPRNSGLGKGQPSYNTSHAFFVNTGDGNRSWQSPVNYLNGQEVIILDVLEKPSNAVVRLSVCMDNGTVSCVGWIEFTKTGHYMMNAKPGSAYSVNPSYGSGFKFSAMILRDGGAAEGKKLDLGQGFIGEPDYSRYFPLKMRIRGFLTTDMATFHDPGVVTPVDAGTTVPTDAGVEPVDSGTPAEPTVDAGSTTEPEVDAGTTVVIPVTDSGTAAVATVPRPADGAISGGVGCSVSGGPAIGLLGVAMILMRTGRRKRRNE